MLLCFVHHDAACSCASLYEMFALTCALLPSLLSQLCKLIEEGKLRPTIDSVFPLAETAAAHEKAEEGHVKGKLVLRVADLKA